MKKLIEKVGWWRGAGVRWREEEEMSERGDGSRVSVDGHVWDETKFGEKKVD